ncbi:hypothetical protein XENORESO_019237 [Xenotaenia resolanae]|uniref:Uncharacterized protein n=1 Tax=Xenotaenia resolanae TaxID=208358 RepID=A0ABV0VU87_9TELE
MSTQTMASDRRRIENCLESHHSRRVWLLTLTITASVTAVSGGPPPISPPPICPQHPHICTGGTAGEADAEGSQLQKSSGSWRRLRTGAEGGLSWLGPLPPSSMSL